VNNLVFAVAKQTPRAMSPYLGYMLNIWDRILSNPINASTLAFVWNNRSDLAGFFIDLVEPLKRFKRSQFGRRCLPKTQPKTRPKSELRLGSLAIDTTLTLHRANPANGDYR
jgi:hypothetical protein